MLETHHPAPQVPGLGAAFGIEVTPDRRRAVIAPWGELDLATLGRLSDTVDELVAGGWRELVFDLRGLSFLDSLGLCYLIRQTRREDVRVELVDGAGAVEELFDTAGVRELLRFVDARPGWPRA
jgi:anti-anti-sigma factor